VAKPKPILNGFQWVLLIAIIALAIKVNLPDGLVVDTNPIDIDGKFVMVVYESEDVDDMPFKQSLIFTSTQLRKYMDDSGYDYRFFDKDVPPSDEPWASAFKLARESIPWVYATNGKSGFSKPLQADSSALQADLEVLK